MEDCGGSFESLSTIQPSARRLDPFWATRLWQKLIREAVSNVKVCRQRHFLKNYDNVFNGEDLVDVIFSSLKQCSSELDVQRIDRTNAVKVCQVLMEKKKLFESVVPKGNLKFEDSSNRLYRFVEDQPEEETRRENMQDKENSRLVSFQQDMENVIMSPYNLNCNLQTPESQEVTIMDSVKRSSKRRSFRIRTPLMRVRDTKPSPVRLSKRNVRDTDHEAFEQLRETALAVLLQLVEVPVLENLLSVPLDLSELPEAPQPFILENDFTPRKMKPSKQDFRGPVADIPWVKAASACLGGQHPSGISGLWSIQACKVLCYKAVVERFSCSPESLIPGEYFPICIAVVKMLKGEQRKRALLALQLLVFHLPWKRKRQLLHLLNFLHLVVQDLFVSVDKKVTNYEAVLRDFLPIVFKHPLVSEEPQKILFDFLLLKSEAVFSIPLNLQNIKESGFGSCKKVQSKTLETFTKEYTSKCLASLAASVVDSTHIKLAEKKTWLKKFKKSHPEVYDACCFTE